MSRLPLLVAAGSLCALFIGCKPKEAEGGPDPKAVMCFALQQFQDSNEIAGAVTLVTGPDKILNFEAFGLADIVAKRPMRKNSLFWIASMTKPITSMGVMMLVEQGKVKLDDPVSKYIPSFKDVRIKQNDTLVAPKRPITVRDLLTHTSGLSNASPTPPNEPVDTVSLEAMADFYAKQPLASEPGAKWSYSNPGMNTLGRIIEVVSGQSYADYLDEKFLTPLGMTGTTFWPDPDDLAHQAKSYRKDKETGELVEQRNPRFSEPLDNHRRTALPAGGLFSCAEDLAKLYQMLLHQGELGGRRYLKAETLRLMTTNQLGDMPKVSFAEGMHMGLGFHIVHEPKGVTESLSPGTFGHGGAYGTQAWIDPVRQRAYVLLIQRTDLPNSDGSDIRREFQKTAVEVYGAK